LVDNNEDEKADTTTVTASKNTNSFDANKDGKFHQFQSVRGTPCNY